MTGTFADQLSAAVNFANLISVQQALLLVAIALPLGFVAYNLVTKVLRRGGRA